MQRTESRSLAKAPITCRPFISGPCRCVDGFLLNFSNTGSYVETSRHFKPGSILLLRMTMDPALLPHPEPKKGLRSICLAEVKWVKELSPDNTGRYGMGVRYLI